MNTSSSPEPTQARSVPDNSVPISENPGHPVNAQGASVYFSRTGNLVGLTPEQQTEALAEAIRSTGPGKVLLLEASGPRDGSYVEELRRTLPAALAQVPPEQRPEIRLFVSDGRPVIGKPDDPNGPHNAFADFLQGLDRTRPGSGIVQEDNSQSVTRAVPNWGNPQVVDYYLRERVQPAIQLARELGIGSVVVDDHIGVPPGAAMTAFKQANGLAPNASSDRQVQDIVTGAYGRVLQTIDDAGLKSGLSVAADPAGAQRFGIDIARLAPRTDTIEIQGYRETAAQVQTMTDRLYENIRDNFDRYRGVDEFKIALTTRANGVDLSEQTLVDQQRVIDRFEERLGGLYRSHGVEPPKVGTSLWAHQNFYEEPTLKLGDDGRRVTQLQEALNGAGIRVDGQPLPTTGHYGEMTTNAVRQYQQQHGLPATGEANKDTLVALGIYPGQQQAPAQTTPTQTAPPPVDTPQPTNTQPPTQTPPAQQTPTQTAPPPVDTPQPNTPQNTQTQTPAPQTPPQANPTPVDTPQPNAPQNTQTQTPTPQAPPQANTPPGDTPQPNAPQNTQTQTPTPQAPPQANTPPVDTPQPNAPQNTQTQAPTPQTPPQANTPPVDTPQPNAPQNTQTQAPAPQAPPQANSLPVDTPQPTNTQTAPPVQTQTDRPSMADPKNPDNALYRQALSNLEQLGPGGGFQSREQMERAAASVAADARASGLTSIDHISKTSTPNGQTLLVAVEGNPMNPASKNSYIDYTQATTQTMDQSTRMAETARTQQVAQQTHDAPQQDTRIAVGAR
ncbi:MAG: XVIPCD domain-containing protein [Lysobacteraceae bacterium]